MVDNGSLQPGVRSAMVRRMQKKLPDKSRTAGVPTLTKPGQNQMAPHNTQSAGAMLKPGGGTGRITEALKKLPTTARRR